jgi:DNA-binding NtrC family response regulator
MKMLVVDDEAIVLKSCRMVLEAEGCEVISAASAGEALAIIEQQTPELLLIDVKMPIHNGMYLMREVKAKWPDIPIIVMSGYATAETIQEAEALGAAAFLPKPFTPDELAEEAP